MTATTAQRLGVALSGPGCPSCIAAVRKVFGADPRMRAILSRAKLRSSRIAACPECEKRAARDRVHGADPGVGANVGSGVGQITTDSAVLSPGEPEVTGAYVGSGAGSLGYTPSSAPNLPNLTSNPGLVPNLSLGQPTLGSSLPSGTPSSSLTPGLNASTLQSLAGLMTLQAGGQLPLAQPTLGQSLPGSTYGNLPSGPVGPSAASSSRTKTLEILLAIGLGVILVVALIRHRQREELDDAGLDSGGAWG
jgi:hypothetical protein